MSTKSKAEFFFEIFIKFGVMRNNLFTRNNVRLDHFFFKLHFKEGLQRGGFLAFCKLQRKFTLIFTFFESTSFALIIDLDIN